MSGHQMTYNVYSLQFVYIKIPSPTAAAEYTVLLLVIELEREPRVMTQFKDAHLAITRVRMEKEKQNSHLDAANSFLKRIHQLK